MNVLKYNICGYTKQYKDLSRSKSETQNTDHTELFPLSLFESVTSVFVIRTLKFHQEFMR